MVAPRYSVSALAAALLERRRTGKGQHIDVSQVESAIHFIEPLVLDETVNGRTAGRAGHDSLTACPHGVYATAGTERYIAIAVETAEQWRALKLGRAAGGLRDPRFDDLEQRRAVRGRDRRGAAAWTRGFEHRELERRLIEAGVPAPWRSARPSCSRTRSWRARQYFRP